MSSVVQVRIVHAVETRGSRLNAVGWRAAGPSGRRTAPTSRRSRGSLRWSRELRPDQRRRGELRDRHEAELRPPTISSAAAAMSSCFNVGLACRVFAKCPVPGVSQCRPCQIFVQSSYRLTAMDRPYLRIGALEQQVGVSPELLRAWEHRIAPASDRMAAFGPRPPTSIRAMRRHLEAGVSPPRSGAAGPRRDARGRDRVVNRSAALRASCRRPSIDSTNRVLTPP